MHEFDNDIILLRKLSFVRDFNDVILQNEIANEEDLIK